MQRRKSVKVIAIIILLIGIAVWSYPKASNMVYKIQVKDKLNTFEEDVKRDADVDRLYRRLKAENEKLYVEGQKNLKDAFSYETAGIDLTEYGLTDNSIGFIDIPKLKVTLPIYLGANKVSMKGGAAHLTNTSYPIGGKNTNSVLAGHRGYARADMFRNIDRLEKGDEVVIRNFKETLKYKVTNTIIVLPTEIDKVLIQKDEDMVTLTSCHPLGQNHHRIIVFCEREV
jgi:sortase A